MTHALKSEEDPEDFLCPVAPHRFLSLPIAYRQVREGQLGRAEQVAKGSDAVLQRGFADFSGTSQASQG